MSEPPSEQPAPAVPGDGRGTEDAERRVAELTGMTPEAAHAFIAFHAGLRAPGPASRSPG
jgi:hypothetical protein